MKLVNNLSIIFGLFGLFGLMVCVISNVSATDYSDKEAIAERLLLDPVQDYGIIDADVSINEQQVTFNCLTDLLAKGTDASLEYFGRFIMGTIATYNGLVHVAPEVGDLLIVMKNNNQPDVATLTCKKSWVQGVDLTSKDAFNDLMYKVLMSMKEA